MLLVAVLTLTLGRTVDAAAQSCAFDAGALPVDTLPPGSLHRPAILVEHVIVMTQENRSFDHGTGS
ncbi:MAG TPA: hypothetical protein VKW76_15555 [Candidatus Binatia bacterium]|nr:hypothetical protein [Candidatus Binatia bacterium]